jgi:hypothetical protein
MKLKNVNLKITVFGGIEKEIVYNKVLWVSPNRKWVLYVNEDYNRIMLEDVINGEGQFPIMYNDGSVAYDNPFIVPKYVKENVARCLRKYNNIK